MEREEINKMIRLQVISNINDYCLLTVIATEIILFEYKHQRHCWQLNANYALSCRTAEHHTILAKQLM